MLCPGEPPASAFPGPSLPAMLHERLTHRPDGTALPPKAVGIVMDMLGTGNEVGKLSPEKAAALKALANNLLLRGERAKKLAPVGIGLALAGGGGGESTTDCATAIPLPAPGSGAGAQSRRDEGTKPFSRRKVLACGFVLLLVSLVCLGAALAVSTSKSSRSLPSGADLLLAWPSAASTRRQHRLFLRGPLHRGSPTHPHVHVCQPTGLSPPQKCLGALCCSPVPCHAPASNPRKHPGRRCGG